MVGTDTTWACGIWFGAESSAKHGEGRPAGTHCAAVEAQAAVQQVCICPHFAFWKQGNRNHLLVNGQLDLWPPTDLIPATIPSSKDCQQTKKVDAAAVMSV
ncbi:hypothetical protein ABBQ38_011316 [Trebouxia sp. C0009 RCD-2024]